MKSIVIAAAVAASIFPCVAHARGLVLYRSGPAHYVYQHEPAHLAYRRPAHYAYRHEPTHYAYRHWSTHYAYRHGPAHYAYWRGPTQHYAPAAHDGSVLAEAARWIGSGNMTGKPGPWCADAVSFWLRRSGHRPLANRMVSSALSYGPRLSGPRVGALAVIRTRRGWAGHVGVVEGVEPNGSIRLVSGNWGHRVAQSVISRNAVMAFVAVP